MPFSESLKAEIRRRADMRCCICHAIGIDVHHVIPQADGGPDDEDNAAPLCPTCHGTYGSNPSKRKFIREARDNWYKVCEQQLNTPQLDLNRLIGLASQGVTRDDLSAFKNELLRDLQTAFRFPALGKRQGQSLGQILQWIYDYPTDADKVTAVDVGFLYTLIWGGSLEDEESEDLKIKFIARFGKETTLRLCRLRLNKHPYSLSKDGFTDPEMTKLVGLVMVDILLLLHGVGA